jgi:hypothetical protein
LSGEAVALKRCTKCGEEKPATEFSRNKRAASGLRSACKQCQAVVNAIYYTSNKEQSTAYYEANKERILTYKDSYRAANRERINAQRAAYRAANKELQKSSHCRRLYGITFAEKQALLAAQGGVCKICNRSEWPGKGPAVDHCHTTGKIRGILCSHCNTAIGLMRDDPSRLRAAIAYLEATNSDTKEQPQC